MSKEIKIGLFGFGCVGQGLTDVLNGSKGFKASIEKIAIKNPSKKRTLPESYFTTDHQEILNNPEINTIVELIDDADAAYNVVTTALKSGKNVVTANKKMLAFHLPELVSLQKEHNASLLYEASACGSIPVIRNLEEYYDNDLLSSVSGIFNGSSNFILSKIFQQGWTYEDALKTAQELGFAETDPILDVGGFDPKFKLVILTYHSFGVYVHPDEVFNFGIQNLSTHDFQYAREKGLKIKLIPTVQKVRENEITLFVLPQLIGPEHYLYNIENEYNGVCVEAAFACSQTFIGKGAGGHPTGSAVLSDISALQYDYKYEYKKANQRGIRPEYTTDVQLEIFLRYNDDKVASALNFSSISEQFKGSEYSFVKGFISLQELIDKQALLLESGSFIASTGQLSDTSVKTTVSNAQFQLA